MTFYLKWMKWERELLKVRIHWTKNGWQSTEDLQPKID